MKDIIIFALMAGIFGFGLYHEKKLTEEKSYRGWLEDVRNTLSCIEYEFQHRCEKIAREYSVKYMDVIMETHIINGYCYEKVSLDKLCYISSEYRDKISSLEQEYRNTLNEKIIARVGKYQIKTVPDHLEREYERNISHIACIFRNSIDSYVIDKAKIRKEEPV